MNVCLSCEKETKNPKFCSRSCSAKVNNVLVPKRISKRKCIVCGDKTSNYRKSRCDLHTEEYKKNRILEKTVGEYRNAISVRGKHASWLASAIRLHARNIHKDLKKLSCAVCGYSKHVEICHKKAVSAFSDSALLKEVNSRDNVIQLCPNCHWEFDNGLIQV